jgi:hypothetical protein
MGVNRAANHPIPESTVPPSFAPEYLGKLMLFELQQLYYRLIGRFERDILLDVLVKPPASPASSLV